MLGLSALKSFVKTVSDRSGATWALSSIKGLLSGRTVSPTKTNPSLYHQDDTSAPKRTSLLSRRNSRHPNVKPRVKNKSRRQRYEKAPDDPAWKQSNPVTPQRMEELTEIKFPSKEDKTAMLEQSKQRKALVENRVETQTKTALKPKNLPPRAPKKYVPGLPGYGHYQAKKNLGLDVPQHKIIQSVVDQMHYPSSDEIDAASDQQLEKGLLHRGPNRHGYLHTIGETSRFSASIYRDKETTYQEFLTGWEQLCGRDHQKQLTDWDSTCKMLQEYLTGQNHPITPADITKQRKLIRRRKNLLSQISIEQRPLVKRYIDSVEQIVDTANEQLKDQRQAVTKEFNGNSATFLEACKEYGIEPRRDFTMNSLQELQSSLNNELNKPVNNDENSLRDACMSTVLKFLDERRLHLTEVTHKTHPETSISPSTHFSTRNLPLPPALPQHPNKSDTTNAYYFSFNGQEPVVTNFDNVHYLTLNKIAQEWQHDSLPPELPQISVQTAPITLDMATDGAAYTVTTHAATPETIAARQQCLLETPLCQINSHGKGHPTPVAQLAAFEKEIFLLWDNVCRHTAGIATPPVFDQKEHLELSAQRGKIEWSLKKLGQQESPSQDAIQYLYLCREVIDQYMKITNNHYKPLKAVRSGLPHGLPVHPNVRPGTLPSAYLFNYDGVEAEFASGPNLHHDIVQHNIREPQVSGDLKVIPSILITPATITEDMADDAVAYNVRSSTPHPSELSTRKKLLMTTPLCSGMTAEASTTEQQYDEFNFTIHGMWDIISGNVDPSDDPISSATHKDALDYKTKISHSLRQLEAMDNPSQTTIQHLYLCQEIIDEYLRVSSPS